MRGEAISDTITRIAHLHLRQVQVSLGYALLAMTDSMKFIIDEIPILWNNQSTARIRST